jgi:16S rRNA processing protein RimM
LSWTSSKKTAVRDGQRSRPPLLLEHDGERLVVVGEVVGTHGVRGEMRVRPFNPTSTVFFEARELFLAGRELRRAELRRARRHGRLWLLGLDLAASPEEASTHVGSAVAVRERDLPPAADREFYCYQLVGLQVVDESGSPLGVVREVLATGAADVLAVARGGREHLVPLVEEFVRQIDLAAGRIVIRPIEGLLEA